jgi:hypothetical protein
MNNLAATAIGWAERGLIPDTLVRIGIRSLLPSGKADTAQEGLSRGHPMQR